MRRPPTNSRVHPFRDAPRIEGNPAFLPLRLVESNRPRASHLEPILRSFSLEPQVGPADADWFDVPRIGAARLTTVFGTVAFGGALVAAHNDDRLTQWVSNVGLVISPVAAAAACWWHARHAPLGSRRAWFLIGLGSLSWGLGQLIWTIYESFLHREVPFPSLADAGY